MRNYHPRLNYINRGHRSDRDDLNEKTHGKKWRNMWNLIKSQVINKKRGNKNGENRRDDFFRIFFRIEIIKPCHERQIGNYLSDVAERNRCSSKAERHDIFQFVLRNCNGGRIAQALTLGYICYFAHLRFT